MKDKSHQHTKRRRTDTKKKLFCFPSCFPSSLRAFVALRFECISWPPTSSSSSHGSDSIWSASLRRGRPRIASTCATGSTADRRGRWSISTGGLTSGFYPATYLPGARSVICVAMNYHVLFSPSPGQGEGRGEGRNAGHPEASARKQTSAESPRFDPHPNPLPARKRGPEPNPSTHHEYAVTSAREREQGGSNRAMRAAGTIMRS